MASLEIVNRTEANDCSYITEKSDKHFDYSIKFLVCKTSENSEEWKKEELHYSRGQGPTLLPRSYGFPTYW